MGRERADKGNGKMVKKAKRTPSEKEWERATVAVDAYNRQQQGQGIQIRDSTTPVRRSTRSRSTRGASSTPSGQSNSRKRACQEPEPEEEEEQQQSAEPQPQAERRLRDLTSYKSPKVKKLRFVSIDEWFPKEREEGTDPRFHTLLQESFYVSYQNLKVSLSIHKTLNWRYMRIAAGGADVRRHFDSIPGLTDLLIDVDHYVEDWVRVFYAIAWIAEDWSFV
jgi:hypothetical protein